MAPYRTICLVASNYSQSSAMCAAMSSLVGEAVRTLTFIATPTTLSRHPRLHAHIESRTHPPLTMPLPVSSVWLLSCVVPVATMTCRAIDAPKPWPGSEGRDEHSAL